jgi:hypothetical protein
MIAAYFKTINQEHMMKAQDLLKKKTGKKIFRALPSVRRLSPPRDRDGIDSCLLVATRFLL